MLREISTALTLVLTTAASAGPKEDGYAVVERWAKALSAGNLDEIVQLYAPDALFYGTTMPNVTATHDDLRKYFSATLPLKPTMKLAEHWTLEISNASVVDAGVYEFSRMRDGQLLSTRLRYSFVVAKRGDEWKIVHHHSSMMPAAR